jgi:hypothetical protein
MPETIDVNTIKKALLEVVKEQSNSGSMQAGSILQKVFERFSPRPDIDVVWSKNPSSLAVSETLTFFNAGECIEGIAKHVRSRLGRAGGEDWRRAIRAGCGSCFGRATRQKFAMMG